MNITPSNEERTWAALAHLSALAFGMGIVLPIVGWSEQRRKSKYASFQSLQALGYQSLGFTIWILSYLVIMVILALIVLFSLPRSGDMNSTILEAALRPWIGIFITVMVGFSALYILLPLIAAIACVLGKDFRYPIIGNHLARYLGYGLPDKSQEQTWLNEDHEFHWVAAMGHFSILIIIWGMLAPLTAWILYGKRSYFLKFQAIQTLLYQAGATLLFFGGALIAGLGLVIFPIVAWYNFSSDLNSSTGMVGIIVFIVLILISMVILLIVPLLHILGQWAGYRVLKGDDYHYPLIGRLVERRLLRKTDNHNSNIPSGL